MKALRWLLGLGVTGLAGLFFLIAAMNGCFDPEMANRSYDIGTGQHLRIKKTVRPYRNWDTGSKSEDVNHVLFYKGAKVGSDALKKWVTWDDRYASEAADIYDAVELQADDFLLLLGNSQMASYDVIRVHLDPNTAALKADVIKLGGEQSEHPWFPASRLPGWTRVAGTNGMQFMIRHVPFQVVPLGQGKVAKLAFPFAFLANQYRRDAQAEFKVINLNDGKMAGSLTLDGQCFTLPEFSFDYPQTDAYANHSDDEVGYDYGPTWWDKNIDWNPQAATLTLKTGHTLAAAPGKVFSIQYVPPQPANPQPATPTNEAMAEPAPKWNADEIDKVPVLAKNCAQENPRGVEKAKSVPPNEEKIDAAAFCLHDDWPVDPAVKQKICGAPTRKKVFSADGVAVHEVTVPYRPISRAAPAIQMVVPEIEMDGKRYIDIDAAEWQTSHGLKELFVLNDSQVLFKARGSGPWVLYLLSAREKGADVVKIGEYGYPGGPFASIGNDNFLYDTRSGTLIRKKPFGYRDHDINLFDIQGVNGVTVYAEGKEVHVQVSRFGLDAGMAASPGAELAVSLSCFGKDDVPQQQMGMTARQQWFNKYFVWSGDGSKVSLKASCIKH